MARGDNLAGSFRLPQSNTSSSRLQSVIDRGLNAEQELIGQNGAYTPEPPKDLQYVKGVTDEVYQKWAALKSFAQTMWNNYRIDVSRPDLRDENSVQAHQAYKKALADVMYSVDLLKNSQRQFEGDQQLVSQGKGVFAQDPNDSPYALQSPDDRFYSTDNLERGVQESNMYLAKAYDTTTARNEANKQIDSRRQYIDSVRNKINTNGGKQTISDIGARLNKATYEQPQFRPYKDNDSGSGDANKKRTVAIDELNYLRRLLYNNDPNGISFLKNQKGVIDVQQVTGNGQDGVRIVTSNGKTYDIDFNSPYGGLDVLNELRNNTLGAKDEIATRDLLPYFDATKDTNKFPDRGTNKQLDRLLKVYSSLYNDEDTEVDDQNREYAKDKLTQAAQQGTLFTRDGKKIVQVEFDNEGGGWFSKGKDPVVILYPENPKADPVEFRLANKTEAEEFKKFVQANSNSLIDWNNINKVEHQSPKEMPVGPMPQNMTREQFEQYLKNKGTFNVDDFIKSKSK